MPIKNPHGVPQGELKKIVKTLKTASSIFESMLDLVERGKTDEESVMPFMIAMHGLSQTVNAHLVATGQQPYFFAAKFFEDVKRAVELGIPGAEDVYNDLSVHFTDGLKPNSRLNDNRNN